MVNFGQFWPNFMGVHISGTAQRILLKLCYMAIIDDKIKLT